MFLHNGIDPGFYFFTYQADRMEFKKSNKKRRNKLIFWVHSYRPGLGARCDLSCWHLPAPSSPAQSNCCQLCSPSCAAHCSPAGRAGNTHLTLYNLTHQQPTACTCWWLSIHPSMHLCIYPCMYVSIYIYISISIYLAYYIYTT